MRGIHQSPDLRALGETIVAMARQMKMRTVAEGIEEVGEMETVQCIGCNVGQGYLFRRPVAAPDFAELLRIWPERVRTWKPAVNEQAALKMGA